MTSVNGAHIHQLLWAALQRGRAQGLELAERAGFADPLSASHLRLLESVPVDGARPTDLAARARITKQALGQLATLLSERGYLETVPDPDDRRAKLVMPTGRGRDVIVIAQGLVPELEARVTGRLSTDRLRALREDLETIRRTAAEQLHREPC